MSEAVGPQEEKKTSAEFNNEMPADSGTANAADAQDGEDCWRSSVSIIIDFSLLNLVFTIPVQDTAVFGIESFESVMTVYGELQASEDKKDKEDLQRLERHMTQARSLVKTYVVLEPETKSDEDLLESLKQSPAGNASGDGVVQPSRCRRSPGTTVPAHSWPQKSRRPPPKICEVGAATERSQPRP